MIESVSLFEKIMMKKYKILLAVLILSGIFISTFSNAHECHLLGDRSLSTLDNSSLMKVFDASLIKNLYPRENFKRALINTKAYCCREGFLTTPQSIESCKEDRFLRGDKDSFPFSPMLFDQLLDVSLRALEWNKKQMYSDALLEKQAKEWRDLMHEFGAMTGGVVPQAIQEKYAEYWENQPEFELIKYQGEELSRFMNSIEWQEKEKAIIKNYAEWSLYTKYQNICSINLYITFMFNKNLNANDALTLFDACNKNLIPKIINQEVSYIQNTIISKSNLLLANAMKNQIDLTFEVRGKSLQGMLQEISSYLTQIYRSIPRLVNKTS